jgi:hypothetical protein
MVGTVEQYRRGLVKLSESESEMWKAGDGGQRDRGSGFWDIGKGIATRGKLAVLRTGVSRGDMAYHSRYSNCRNGAYRRGLYTKRHGNM